MLTSVAHLTVEFDAGYSVAHLTVELDADCSVACSSDWLDGELPRRIIQPVEYRVERKLLQVWLRLSMTPLARHIFYLRLKTELVPVSVSFTSMFRLARGVPKGTFSGMVTLKKQTSLT